MIAHGAGQQALRSKRVRHRARLWEVRRADNVTVHRWTSHDQDVKTGFGLFLATGGIRESAIRRQAGLADHLTTELSGHVGAGISFDDLRARKMRDAQVVLYESDWRWPYIPPTQTHVFLVRDIRYDELRWTLDLVGWEHSLRRRIGRVYSRSCQNTLGDAICQVDLDDPAFKFAGTVVGSPVTPSRIKFSVNGSFPPESADFWAGGFVTWNSGANAGTKHQIIASSAPLATVDIELYAATPFDVAVNDTCDLTVGCDKRFVTCDEKFANTDRFRGFPDIPGTGKTIRSGDAT